MRAQAPAARGCYQHALTRAPGLAGKLVIGFTIGAPGAVSKAHVLPISTLHDDAVAACVIAIVGKLQFPASTGEINVNYPFAFSPAP